MSFLSVVLVSRSCQSFLSVVLVCHSCRSCLSFLSFLSFLPVILSCHSFLSFFSVVFVILIAPYEYASHYGNGTTIEYNNRAGYKFVDRLQGHWYKDNGTRTTVQERWYKDNDRRTMETKFHNFISTDNRGVSAFFPVLYLVCSYCTPIVIVYYLH